MLGVFDDDFHHVHAVLGSAGQNDLEFIPQAGDGAHGFFDLGGEEFDAAQIDQNRSEIYRYLDFSVKLPL